MPPPHTPEKYRSAAFHLPAGDDMQEVRFWTLEESFDHRGSYIREHFHHEEMFGDGAESRPVTDPMPEREAFAHLLKLQSDDATRYDRVDDQNPRWKRLLGAEYFDATPAVDFPALVAERDREKLKLIRSCQPSNWLRPRK